MSKEQILVAAIEELKMYQKALREIAELPDLIEDPFESDPGDTIAKMQQTANDALSYYSNRRKKVKAK